jgi:hypothetical protein
MSIGFYETLCRLCKHRQGFGCAAYPKKIPLDIRLMYVDHRQPYHEDNGIRFEPKDDSPRTLERLAKVELRKRAGQGAAESEGLSDAQREILFEQEPLAGEEASRSAEGCGESQHEVRG